LLVRLLPRRHRFPAAVRVARALQPLIRRTSAYATRALLRTDTIRETSLDLVLMMLTRHGTEFDPHMTIIGEELLPSLERAGPTLLAIPHTMLSALITRYLADAGVAMLGISADPIRIPGTRLDAHIVLPSRTLLVTVRDAFASGAIVAAMIDRGNIERRNTSVATTRGDFLVSTPLLEIALRQRARIVFLSAMLDAKWNVTMTVVEPPQDANTNVDALVTGFAAFVDAHVHAVHAG
jgi:hypothetical protein